MADGNNGTPEQHAGTAHPTVADRLLEDMDALTNLADQTPASMFVGDKAWAVLQRHLESLEKLAVEVEGLRPNLTEL